MEFLTRSLQSNVQGNHTGARLWHRYVGNSLETGRFRLA